MEQKCDQLAFFYKSQISKKPTKTSHFHKWVFLFEGCLPSSERFGLSFAKEDEEYVAGPSNPQLLKLHSTIQDSTLDDQLINKMNSAFKWTVMDMPHLEATPHLIGSKIHEIYLQNKEAADCEMISNIQRASQDWENTQFGCTVKEIKLPSETYAVVWLAVLAQSGKPRYEQQKILREVLSSEKYRDLFAGGMRKWSTQWSADTLWQLFFPYELEDNQLESIHLLSGLSEVMYSLALATKIHPKRMLAYYYMYDYLQEQNVAPEHINILQEKLMVEEPDLLQQPSDCYAMILWHAKKDPTKISELMQTFDKRCVNYVPFQILKMHRAAGEEQQQLIEQLAKRQVSAALVARAKVKRDREGKLSDAAIEDLTEAIRQGNILAGDILVDHYIQKRQLEDAHSIALILSEKSFYGFYKVGQVALQHQDHKAATENFKKCGTLGFMMIKKYADKPSKTLINQHMNNLHQKILAGVTKCSPIPYQ